MRRFTLNKLAQITGHSRHTLTLWREQGWLKPCCKVGARYLYTERNLEEAEHLSLGTIQNTNIIDFKYLRRKYAL